MRPYNDGKNRKLNKAGNSMEKTQARNVFSQMMENPVGSDHLAWNILIQKLDFLSQYKISQLNQELADLVEVNAEYELQKFQRRIRDDKNL